jgi:hypothetical protein
MQVLRLVGVVVRVRNGGARTGCRGAGVSGCRRPGCQVGPGGGLAGPAGLVLADWMGSEN